MELDPRRTALVMIDLMPRIIGLPDIGPHSGTDVLARSLELAAAFRKAGATVVAVRVDRPNVTEQPPGSGFADGVVAEGDIAVVKRSIGAFATSDLHDRLQAHGIDTLVMTGIATTLGVESTARGAADLGYELVFAEDAMTGPTAQEHEASIRYDFPHFGTLLPTADVLAALLG